MSRISQDFINSVGYLYEEINIQQNDFLNEESQYYDEEASELVEDIIATISTSMVYEGYSANAIIAFLADSPEESIIEKYFSFDESILIESNVSEEYIEEQLQQLDEIIGAALRIAGAGLKAAKYAKNVKGAAPIARLSAGLKGAGTAAERVAKQGIKASSVVRSTLSKGVQKVKDVAKGAKAALTSPTAKKIATGALIGGTGVLAGYAGAKLGSGDSKVGPKLVGPKIVGPKLVGPKIVGPTSSSSSGGGGSNSSGGGGSSTPSSASPKPSPAKSAVKAQTGDKTKDMDTWAKANPKLAAAKAERDRTRGTSSTTNPLMADIKSKLPDATPASTSKPGPKEKQNQTPTTGPTPAIPDLKSVNADLKKSNSSQELNKPAPAGSALAKEQERRKKQSSTTATSESYDAYDLVLEYLFSQGHVETLEEANYVMLVMDAETIGSIVEECENDLLAEEITEWVNELVEEGYDLSEYTWEDLAEYYVNEAKVDKYLDNKLKKSNSLGDDEMGRSMRKDIKMSQRRKRASVTPDTPRQRRLAQKLRDNRDANNDEGPLGYAARSEEK